MNWLNESENNSESVEIANNVKNEDFSYYKELSKKCARKKLSWDSSSDTIKNLDFYNDFNSKVYNKDKFFEDLKKDLPPEELKKVLKLTEEQKNELFETSFSTTINKIWFTYERKKEELKSLIEKKYTLNDKQKKDLFSSIFKLNSEELDKYIFYPEELENYLKSIAKISSESEQIKEIRTILKNFSYSSPNEFREKIKKEIEKNPSIWSENEIFASLKAILTKAKIWEPLDSIDIRDIFSYWIFSEEQKKQFLKVFLPSITINELVGLWIIDNEQANNIKKEEIIKQLKKKRGVEKIDDNDVELNEIINYIEFKDIFVSTDAYLNSYYVKLVDSELFKDVVLKSINKTNEEIKEKNLAKFQTLEIFKHKIIENRNILYKLKWWKDDLEKLQNWNIFRFKIDKEDDNSYYEITEFGNDWTFKWKNRWIEWDYNSSSNVPEQEVNYEELFNLLSADKLKEIELLTKEDIKSRVESWGLIEIKDELGIPRNYDLQKYKEELKEKLEKLKDWKTNEELEKNVEYKELESKLKMLEADNALENQFVIELLNLYLLKEKIDSLDEKWKEFWLSQWVSFKLDEWEDKEFRVYTIININDSNKIIEIINPIWDSEFLTFDQFYKSFIKNKWKVTRFTNNNEIAGLVNSIWNNEELFSIWREYEIKDWKLMKKEQEKITYPYLTQELSKTGSATKMLKIHDTVWTWINQKIWISFWEVWQVEIDTWKKDEKWKPIKEKKDSYELDSNKHYVTLAFLENYIKEHKLKPKTLEKEKSNDNIKPTKNPQWWFTKWLLSNKSVNEIIKWMKLWFDEFKNHLKWWNEEHAAKVALATWGRFLPMEVKMELTARVEKAEAWHMEEYVKRLETMDSWQAVKLINQRLKYSNTEEYKKEAWMIFMLKKYGSLYNKSPLNEKKWQFLWFKAMTWNRWDVTKHELYKKVKWDCEREKRNFTEEELVWKLMKVQCSEHWYMWKHRRSRLHKEVEKLKKAWLNDEFEDGLKKAWETRNPDEQLSKGISEFEAWSPWNWVWRLQWLIDRWTSMENYNQIPFMLICSWNWKTYSDFLSNKIKWLIDSKRPVLLWRYMSYPADMDLAKEAIRVLAHKIQWYDSVLYPDIATKIEELYKYTDSTDPNITEWMKIKECNKFYKTINKKTWKTYWDILTRAMYGLADWNNKDWDDINCLIVANKDKPWSDNLVLQSFYDKMIGFSFSNDYSSDDYMSDSFLKVWTSTFWPNVVKTVLKQESWGWFRMVKSWPKMAEEIKWEIDAIKKRKYKDEEYRKLWLKHYLKIIFAWILEGHQTKLDAATAMFKWVWALKFFHENRWINFNKFVELQLNQNDIMWWNEKSEKLFDNFVDNILNDKKPWDVSSNIFSIIEKNITDDYQYKKVA